jgi:hypothetical protein
MRDTNLLDTEVDSIQEAEDLKSWLVMMVEINGTDSAYGRELSKILAQVPISKNAHVVDAQTTGALAAHLPLSCHRNGRRREKFERESASRRAVSKGKAVETSDSEVLIPRRAHRFKDCVTRELGSCKSSGKRKPLTSPPPDPTPLDDPPTGKPVPEVTDTTIGKVPEREEPPIVRAHRARSMPPGLGSLGIRALHLKVHVGAPDAPPLKGRLDSGSNITLMSEEYFNSLPGLPKPREGLRM